MALHFVVGQPFRSLSLDLRADGGNWHPKSHISLGLPLGCVRKSKIRTALGMASHELVNHISTDFWLLGRFTVKTHLAKVVIMIHPSCVIMIHPKASTGLPKASPNIHQTFPKPSPSLPKEFSTIPRLSPCTQAFTNHFLTIAHSSKPSPRLPSCFNETVDNKKASSRLPNLRES